MIYPQKAVVNIGQSVHFVCYSHSRVYWDLHGYHFKLSTMPNANILDNNTLVINNIHKYNEGYYYCNGETSELTLKGLKRKYQQFNAKGSLWIRGTL